MNHPFQYLYFNFFTLNKWNLNFEMDYSGVSFKQGVKYILSIDTRDKINVNIDTLYAYKAYHSLNSNEKKKILINDSGFPYDYIIINYRYKQDKSDYFYLEQSIELKKRGYIKIYDFKVDKNVFLSIFSN
jgi:hypothetical protein